LRNPVFAPVDAVVKLIGHHEFMIERYECACSLLLSSDHRALIYQAVKIIHLRPALHFKLMTRGNISHH
jgi:hypothetical protein